MRKIFPRRSLVLDDDFCASNGLRPARSSDGLNPFDSKGDVLSPVDKKRFPFASNVNDPPVWQQVSRCVGTSRITFSDAISNLSVKTNRDRMLAVFSGCA